MIPPEAFFTIHRDLPREGPGEAADVLWALDLAKLPEAPHICDAACGPGADTVTLAEACPDARIDACDLQEHFVTEAKLRLATFGTRVAVSKQNYLELQHSYDLIWCAGAIYFNGIERTLEKWRSNLNPGGRIAFSEPALISDPASPRARSYWADEYDVQQAKDLRARLHTAGWKVLGERWVIGAPWEAYYKPMEARLKQLKAKDPLDEALNSAIAEHEAEIAGWQAAPDQIAYLLFLVEPA